MVTVSVTVDVPLLPANVVASVAASEKVPGTPPIPDKATVCELFASVSVTVSVPDAGPVAVGVKVTLMVQVVALAANELPQLLVCEKGPLVPMPVITRVLER